MAALLDSGYTLPALPHSVLKNGVDRPRNKPRLTVVCQDVTIDRPSMSVPPPEVHRGNYLSNQQEHIHVGRNTASTPSSASARHSFPPLETAPVSSPDDACELFIRGRSRVLQLHKPWLASGAELCAVQMVKELEPTFWQVGDGFDVNNELWVVFRTHEEACTALRTDLIFTPASEHHLEATHNLHNITWRALEDMSSLALSAEPFGRSAASYSPPWHSSNNDLRLERLPSFNPASRDAVIHQHYNISSNPPNPKLSFRAGDWWCPVAHCAAHNFGRNVGCIKCGTPRASNGAHPGSGHHSIRTSPPPQISPRFINHPSISDDVGNMLEHRLPPQHVMRTQLPPVNNQGPSAQSLNVGSRAPAPQYPILTPSGSALSAGGRVRNVSNDPLSPCILYWPDNEPLPEPGQVRPFGSAVIQFPPIINTGNKGAAEKQPGDWICQKCKYLNWRRRKVCQTCFPYAEGNGDSISSAVQAERIALLAGVLNKADPSPVVQRQLPPPLNGYARESSQIWPDASVRVVPRPEVPTKIQQIYQTPDSISYSSHAVRKEFLVSQTQTYATPTVSRNLLPSFLQDIVHSPALSPAGSTSSSETGLEESFAAFDISDSLAAAARLRRHPYSTSSSSSVSSTSIGSIWKLDGEESKVLGLGNVSPMEKAASAAFASYA